MYQEENKDMEYRYKKALESSFKKYELNFNKELCMVKTRRGNQYGYHTNLRNCDAHMTRESLYYALGLLHRNEEKDLETAQNIIEKVLTLQDMDKENKTYGIWPWYLEEPISEMPEPDFNWADFCGKTLLQIFINFKDKLYRDIVEKMEKSIEAVCYSIMKRDVPASYTNISIMGTYVLLIGGEVLNNNEIVSYGKRRLKEIYRYNMYHGAFTEYNSPTYTIVAIEDLSLMLISIKDMESYKLLKELNDMAWFFVAKNFHARTLQWGGPHSRCYNTLQGKRLLSLIQLATDENIKFLENDDMDIDISWPSLKFICPKKYWGYFVDMESIIFTKDIVFKEEPSVTAASYITPKFSLGSFNRCDFWNQRRNLIAYWGTAKAPSYMRARFLHDGYDFSSAILKSVQHRNIVLGIINFCTGYGDRHFTLDKIKDAGFMARDLRLRFEFGGNIENIKIDYNSDYSCYFIVGENCKMILKPGIGSFDGREVKIEVEQEKDTKFFDFIYYNGEEKNIDLSTVEEAFGSFALMMFDEDLSNDDIFVRVKGIKFDKNECSISVSYEDEYETLEVFGSIKAEEYIKSMKNYRTFENCNIKSSNHIWVVR